MVNDELIEENRRIAELQIPPMIRRIADSWWNKFANKFIRGGIYNSSTCPNQNLRNHYI